MEGGERASAWAQHIFGLAKLIRTRGPSRFNNKMEMLILRPMIGWIVSHSITQRLLGGQETDKLINRTMSLSATISHLLLTISHGGQFWSRWPDMTLQNSVKDTWNWAPLVPE